MLVGPQFWSKNEWQFSTMSAATVLDHEQNAAQLFTITTEGFLLIMAKNNWSRWKAMCKFWENCGDWGATLPVVLTDEKLAAAKAKDPNYVQDPVAIACAHAEYTSSTSGQQKDGTFSDEGKEKFAKYCKEIKKNRKKRKIQIVAFDEQVLKMVREEKGITALTLKEHLAMSTNRKRTPGTKPTVPAKKLRLWNLNDEDGDDSDDDVSSTCSKTGSQTGSKAPSAGSPANSTSSKASHSSNNAE